MARTANTKKSISVKDTKVNETDKTKKVEKVVEVVHTDEVAVEAKAKPTKEVASRDFKSDDQILCRSVCAGELILIGKKSENRYIWSGTGDEVYVLYEDLLSLKVSHSNYLFGPLFIVLEEELVKQWSELDALYKNLLSISEIDELLQQSPTVIKETLLKMPVSFLETLKTIFADKIATGELDSIKRIKVLDEVLDTDYSAFIN